MIKIPKAPCVGGPHCIGCGLEPRSCGHPGWRCERYAESLPTYTDDERAAVLARDEHTGSLTVPTGTLAEYRDHLRAADGEIRRLREQVEPVAPCPECERLRAALTTTTPMRLPSGCAQADIDVGEYDCDGMMVSADSEPTRGDHG